MNSEKKVVDLKNEELVKISKQKEDAVSFKLRYLLECKSSKEKQIANLQEDIAKTDAKITELESLTVEDAYNLAQKENVPSSNFWYLAPSFATLSYS